MNELLKEILGKFKGADWWIVIAALVIDYGTWEYKGKSDPVQSKFLRQVAAVTVVAVVAVAVIVVRQRHRSIAAGGRTAVVETIWNDAVIKARHVIKL